MFVQPEKKTKKIIEKYFDLHFGRTVIKPRYTYSIDMVLVTKTRLSEGLLRFIGFEFGKKTGPNFSSSMIIQVDKRFYDFPRESCNSSHVEIRPTTAIEQIVLSVLVFRLIITILIVRICCQHFKRIL